MNARKLMPSLVNINEIREILYHILSDRQINTVEPILQVKREIKE